MKSFSLLTFGCKTNQYEGEALRELLISQGWEEVSGKADIFIINACSVTGRAEKEWLNLAGKLRRNNPEVFLVLTGCFPNQPPQQEELRKYFHLIIGFGERDKLPDLLKGRTRGYFPSNLEVFEPLRVREHKGHTRAFLKVEDGCHLGCSYCIVPFLRGSSIRSKPLEIVQEEFLRLLKSGFYEVVLTGTHLGAYGQDLGIKLTDLLKELLSISYPFRLRLSSIEPQEINVELLELMKSDPRLARHLHLPLQSGSLTVLKMMKRLYTPREYLQQVEKARYYLPDIGISTDVLIGFPGEKEEDFAETLGMLEKISFVRVHLFPFSPRPYTLASQLPEVSRAVVSTRMKLARIKASESQNRYASSMIGKTLEVLAEKKRGRFYEGYSSEYLRVRFWLANKDEVVIDEEDERRLSELYLVKIENNTRNCLEGVVLD